MKALRTIAVILSFAFAAPTLRAQEPEIDRPPPPRLDSFEVDANGDSVPDGWYNLRDVRWTEGGVSGPRSHCFRFENVRPGRPSRASRAFGIDGRKVDAVIIALWVRAEGIGPGQRLGDDPGLVIDFLGDKLRPTRRAMLGPWTKTIGPKWTRVAKRISVPPGTRDAIMSLGLVGATGILEVDDLTIDMILIGAESSPNLVANGDFELGDPAPVGWVVENGAHRGFPGHGSPSAVELLKSGSRLISAIGTPVDALQSLTIGVSARPKDLRGADAAEASLFFVDDDGRPLSGPEGSRVLFRWAGTSDWSPSRASVNVPQGATRAVLQFEKTNGTGSLWIDDVVVTSSPQPDPTDWKPYRIETDKTGWIAVEPSTGVAADSALDASALLDGPAGKHGFVGVKAGRLTFADGVRARFFGVQFLPPTAFLDAARADALVDRLARSGVNLVRLGDLDSALGPTRSLFDDTREDTRAFDPVALDRLDHLLAGLKGRGIYVAIELQSARRFRPEDDVPSVNLLPGGGGPAAIFDPKLRAATLKLAQDLLGHVNPETGLALKDDPALAWVTLFGELSLFDQIDDPTSLPAALAADLKPKGQGRSGWRTVESTSLKDLADDLRSKGLHVPIAGVSHWRREADFAASTAASGLDLVDDRLFWTSPTFAAPGRRSIVWSREGGLLSGAGKKRKTDRPYVVGQWCDQTQGAWSLPYEGADLMLAVATAASEDWDGFVRRGIFVNPIQWGGSAPGNGGGDDLYPIPEALNAIPPVYGLLPHAASILLRAEARHRVGRAAIGLPGWDSRNGRLIIETPYTQALAGWPGGQAARSPELTIEAETPYCVVAASSFGREPIATANRLLVTAVARVEPTAFAWVDGSKREVADIGRPPLLAEPVRAKVTWRRAGKLKAFLLDADGKRTVPAITEKIPDGIQLIIDGRFAGMHWELVVE